MDSGPVVVLCLTFTCLWAGGSSQQDFAAAALNNKQHLVGSTYRELSADSVSLEAATKSLQKVNAFWLPDVDILEHLEVGNDSRNLSAECVNGRDYLWNTKDPTTGLPLIVKMVDAMGKIGPGFIGGNIYASGAYDECLDIGHAEYCVGKVTVSIPGIKTPAPLTWTYGMCVPQGCAPEDVAYAVNIVTVGLASVNLSTFSCMSTREPPYNAGAIIMILVCFIFIALVMAATVFDFIIQQLQTIEDKSGQIQTDNYRNSKLSEKSPLVTKAPATAKPVKRVKVYDFIIAFSLFKVLSQILSTKQPPSAITSINGLRVMSMFWVILCHTHFWVSLTGADNAIHIKSVLSRFSFQAIDNAFFSVDSFFFLSGLLVAYLSMREMKRKNGRFPFLSYYLHRYLRLTPTYAFIMFFIWLLMLHLADGPMYHSVGMSNYHNCKKYWWTNLFYVNNLYPWRNEEECIPWTWYLANDMQFYIFSPLILIPLYFLFPLGLVISAVVLLVSFVVSGTLASVYDHQANEFASIAYNYESNNTSPYTTYTNLLYIKPWHRVAPYIVGLILGYVLYCFRLPKTKRYVNYPVFLVMWIFSGIFLISTLYGLYFQWHGHVPTKAENVIYITFSRFTWSLGLALLVFSCHHGYGGPINWFLSMKFWIPLSRVSYNAYLIHPLFLTIFFGSERKVINYQDFNLAVYAIGMVVLSFGAAAVVSVFVEFPIGNLEQAFFNLVGLGRHESARTGGEDRQPEDSVPKYVRAEEEYTERPTLGKNSPHCST